MQLHPEFREDGFGGKRSCRSAPVRRGQQPVVKDAPWRSRLCNVLNSTSRARSKRSFWTMHGLLDHAVADRRQDRRYRIARIADEMEALRLGYFKVRSNSFKIRLYSSVQLADSTNP